MSCVRVHRNNAGKCMDVVGLSASENGRSCDRHPICGSVVTEGSVLRARHVELPTGGAMAVHLIEDGIESCRVGFLKNCYIKYHERYNGRLLKVIRLYAISPSQQDRRRSHRYRGMCLCKFLT